MALSVLEPVVLSESMYSRAASVRGFEATAFTAKTHSPEDHGKWSSEGSRYPSLSFGSVVRFQLTAPFSTTV